MGDIHAKCCQFGEDGNGNINYVKGANIAGSVKVADALLDRLTHHVHILELNGESYRLEHSKKARPPAAAPAS